VEDGDCPLVFNAAKLDWTSAEAHCVGLGGHLATIADEATAAWVDENFIRPAGQCHPAWIGFSDGVVEGDWRWADGSPASAFEHWWAGEPNNAGGGPGEDCASLGADCLYHVAAVGSLWVDSGCGVDDFEYRARASVCQLRPARKGECVPEGVKRAEEAGDVDTAGCPWNPCPMPALCGEARPGVPSSPRSRRMILGFNNRILDYGTPPVEKPSR